MTTPNFDIEQLEPSRLFLLAESTETDGTLLDLIVKYYLTDEPLLEKVVRNPHVEQTTLNYIRLFGPPGILSFLDTLNGPHADPISDLEIQQRRVATIGQLRVPEKIQLALKGNREARSLLIRDANRTVALAVLQSPKLTEDEVERIVQSRNVSEDVLRVISRDSAWRKNYAIRDALTSNPKTPLAISMGFLKELRGADVDRLAKDKGVPSALRTAAGRMIATKNLRRT